MLSNKFLISLLLLCAATIPASASVVTYCANGGCDQLDTAFAGATAGLTFGSNITFLSSQITGGNTEYDDPSGTSFFDFHSNGTALDDELIVSGTVLQVGLPSASDLVEITLPANTLAFAMNVRTTSGTANFCIGTQTTFACSAQANTVTSSVNSFIGFVSTTPITNVWIGTGTSAAAIQDFELGTQAADTPEAATLVLIGSGLISLRWLRRRQTVAV